MPCRLAGRSVTHILRRLSNDFPLKWLFKVTVNSISAVVRLGRIKWEETYCADSTPQPITCRWDIDNSVWRRISHVAAEWTHSNAFRTGEVSTVGLNDQATAARKLWCLLAPSSWQPAEIERRCCTRTGTGPTRRRGRFPEKNGWHQPIIISAMRKPVSRDWRLLPWVTSPGRLNWWCYCNLPGRDTTH